MKNNQILALFDQWNNALKTGNPKEVAALYATDAILLPTVSNKVRHNHEEIEDYFVLFRPKSPQAKSMNPMSVFSMTTSDEASGVYTFTFADGSSVQARFTYVYKWDGENRLIIEHSSQMPE